MGQILSDFHHTIKTRYNPLNLTRPTLGMEAPPGQRVTQWVGPDTQSPSMLPGVLPTDKLAAPG